MGSLPESVFRCRLAPLFFGAFLFAGIFAFGLPHVLTAQGLTDDVVARRAQLERELQQLEVEIREQSRLLVDKRQERVSIERDVAILNAEIKKAQLSIRARQIEIERLGTQIGSKEEHIVSLNEKLVREKESLAQMLRKTSEIDDYSLVEVALSNQNISHFFQDLDTFAIIKRELAKSFEDIAITKEDTRIEKLSLEEKQAAEVKLRNLQELEKAKIEEAEAEKRRILAVTKGQEATYQSIIASKEKTAAEIRSALFALRDSADISFGQAYDYAKAAEAVTGVRAAFVLGILKNESDLGKNVGQCLLTEPQTGTGVGKNTGRTFQNVMKPGRDVEPFLSIAQDLGFDPYSQVVSCPQSIGYGGAMGPAQFIPSTWMLYRDRIASATGENPPNPWNPRTAFFASSLLLADNGADRGTHEAERLAALRYFAGWANAENPAFASYGDRVMAFAAEFESQIRILVAAE
jgi:membrane-bound lytic murein transglycosylase B